MQEKRFPHQYVLAPGIVLIVAGFVLAPSATRTGGHAPGEAIATGEARSDPGLGPESDSGPRQLVRVFIHDEEIYPDVIRIRPGRVLIRVQNETVRDLALVVERVTPGRANQRLERVPAARALKRSNRPVALGVGEYVFFEESRPELRGTIMVEEN